MDARSFELGSPDSTKCALGKIEVSLALSRGAERYLYLRLDTGAAQLGNIALSLGERVSGDGAFSSRRRTGEGFLPFANHFVRLKLRIRYSLPLPLRPAPCGATQPQLKTPHRPRCATGG
jgi:hypothetical protein